MSDQLTFTDTLTTAGVNPGVSNLSGTVVVDPSTNTVQSGSLSLTAAGDVAAQTYTNLAVSQTGTSNGVPVYTLTGSNSLTDISIVYTGDSPTSNTATVTALGTGLQVASGSGSVATTTVACYLEGTMILTAEGEIPVQDLVVGDLVVTASGTQRPICWIGRRTIDCRNHTNPRAMWPIRVRADALGPALPASDLYLSAGHSIRVSIVDDVLMPADKLINGASIVRHPVDEVTYWHVELGSHDLLLANNLPAESFVDCGNRVALVEHEGSFDRTVGPHTPADFCLPYIDGGPVLDVVRSRLADLAARQGWIKTHDMDVHLVVDGVRSDPDIMDGTARFLFPASAKEVVLVSHVYVPSDSSNMLDHRRLGLSVNGFQVEDGLAVQRAFGPDDPLFEGLFHPEEAAASVFHRFTDGRTILPPVLWDGCRTHVILRVGYDPQSGHRWLPPANSAAEASAPEQSNVVSLRVA